MKPRSSLLLRSKRPTGPAGPSYQAPALEKGLDILEQLSGSDQGLTQNDIARLVGRSVSEIFRVLSTLEQRGYVTRVQGRYRLSLRLFQLAHNNPPVERLLWEALPVMRALAARAQQSCHIAVRHEDLVLVIGQMNAPTPIGLGVRLGSCFPVAETTSGLVLLAYESPATVEAWLKDLVPAERKRAHSRGIPDKLAMIRRRGFHKEPSANVTGVTNLSYPIKNHLGDAIAALTLLYLGQTTNPAPLGAVQQMVGDAARQIGLALGAQHEA